MTENRLTPFPHCIASLLRLSTRFPGHVQYLALSRGTESLGDQGAKVAGGGVGRKCPELRKAPFMAGSIMLTYP